jgi:hypothetical protein
MLGSVNRRNFVPVSVWKHVSVKNEEDSERIPDDGMEGSGGLEVGSFGVSERVIACTPWKVPARMSISLEERWWRGEVEDCVVGWGVVDGVVVVDDGGPFCAGMKLRW